MATCDLCEQDMTESLPCTWKPIVEVEGVPRPRAAYGRDGYTDATFPPTCHDCGTPQGGLHHPGCDIERCPDPSCLSMARDEKGQPFRRQAISCGCHWEGDKPESEEA